MNQQISNDIVNLILEGHALHQQGRVQEAIDRYHRVLARDPEQFDALHLLGIAALQRKQYELALELLDKAVRINPQHPHCHSNQGVALQELGRLEEAMQSFDRAIAADPAYADPHFNRGNVLKDLKRLDEALQSYNRAIELRPDFVQAYSNRGLVLQAKLQLDEALANYDHAIALKPDYFQAHLNRGNVMVARRRFEDALNAYNAAIAISPDLPETYSNRGNVLKELRRFDEALESYDQAIRLNPAFAPAHSNRGSLLQERNRFAEAIEGFETAIRLKPDYAEAYSNRGVALQGQRRFEEAMVSFHQALAIDPDYADGQWNLALCHLLLGNAKAGFVGYESRWKRETFTSPRRNFTQPLWLGDASLKGKTILLHAEQGYGDTLQFCRYIPMVAELGAKIILEVERPLIGLLGQLDGVSIIIGKGSTLPAFDYHCPLLSLALAFNTDFDNVPAMSFKVDHDRLKREHWHAKLPQHKALKIGIVWSGSTTHANDHNRSLTLAQLLPYLPPQHQYISLQNELRPEDQETLSLHPEIVHFGDQIKDFSDTALLCEMVDVIVSIDSAVAHLAGSLGRPTWLLLPYNPDWRWMLDRTDSPWYPHHRLFRQTVMSDWTSVLDLVQRELNTMSSLS